MYLNGFYAIYDLVFDFKSDLFCVFDQPIGLASFPRAQQAKTIQINPTWGLNGIWFLSTFLEKDALPLKAIVTAT